MEYIEALRLLQRRDDWERTGSARDAARWDLRRMRSLLARLGDPHLGRHTVHVAGSRGKGSVASMIASVLRAAGNSTGLYTSPHLHRFVERIDVDGEPVSTEDFARLLGDLWPSIEAEDADGDYGAVSTFETLTALAFLHFREQAVGWQVLEVGMGGRLDATNVVEEKDVCVVTPVGLEHAAVLGSTVSEIAEEKAGIIVGRAPVVMAPQRESAADVVRRVCYERGARVVEVAKACAMSRGGSGDSGQRFTLRTPHATYKLSIPLLGHHQLGNAATAVLALETLATGELEIGEQATREGLTSVRWPCRIDVLRRRPFIVADGAHDRDSARALARTLREDLGRSNVVLVVGCARDKDVAALADELVPAASHVVATRSRHPRAMDTREVVRVFREREVPVSFSDSVDAAMESALVEAGDGGTTVICGSLAVAAEAKEHLLGVAFDPPLEPAQAGSLPDQSEVTV